MSAAITANADLKAALERARTEYAARNRRSGELYDQACAVLPGGNTRTVLFYPPFPVTLVKGEGSRLWDADGHEYIDFLGEYSAGLFGHSHPAIRAAIERALDDGIDLGGHSALEARLAAEICARFPSVERVRFTNSGTEANLMALSAARAITGRSKILVFDGAYHGGVFLFGDGGSPINAPFEFLVAPYNDVDRAVNMIGTNESDLAAVIVEPMMGNAGCIPGHRAFLQALRQAASRHHALLVFDEVMTSRLSPGGLQEAHGILPDLTTLGKYLGGGMSFGAFGGRADLMARFDARRAGAFPHAGTFNNNVLSMSAGLAGLAVYAPEVVRSHNGRGDSLRGRLNEILRRNGANMQFTGVGSMLAAHMHCEPVQNHADAARGDTDLRELFFLDMIEQGIWIARRGMMALSLAIGDPECDRLAEALEEFVHGRRSLICN